MKHARTHDGDRLVALLANLQGTLACAPLALTDSPTFFARVSVLDAETSDRWLSALQEDLRLLAGAALRPEAESRYKGSGGEPLSFHLQMMTESAAGLSAWWNLPEGVEREEVRGQFATSLDVLRIGAEVLGNHLEDNALPGPEFSGRGISLVEAADILHYCDGEGHPNGEALGKAIHRAPKDDPLSWLAPGGQGRIEGRRKNALRVDAVEYIASRPKEARAEAERRLRETKRKARKAAGAVSEREVARDDRSTAAPLSTLLDRDHQ